MQGGSMSAMTDDIDRLHSRLWYSNSEEGILNINNIIQRQGIIHVFQSPINQFTPFHSCSHPKLNLHIIKKVGIGESGVTSVFLSDGAQRMRKFQQNHALCRGKVIQTGIVPRQYATSPAHCPTIGHVNRGIMDLPVQQYSKMPIEMVFVFLQCILKLADSRWIIRLSIWDSCLACR